MCYDGTTFKGGLLTMRIVSVFVISALTSFYAAGEVIDAIVATVDREVILLSDVQAEIAPQIAELRETAVSQEEFTSETDRLIRETLEQQIERRVLLREALLLGITVDENRIEDRIEELRAMYASDDEFMKELALAGQTLSDFREQTRKSYLSQVMARSKMKEIEDRTVVSQQEIVEYYEEHLDEFSRPERVFIRQIFLRARTAEDREQARAKLENLKNELEAGADFGDLARTHSEMAGAEQGGVVGWHTRGELVKSLEDAVFALPAGGISDVIETPGGVTLIKVDQHEDADTPELDVTRTVIEPKVRQKKARAEYEVWLQELRRRSQVRVFL